MCRSEKLVRRKGIYQIKIRNQQLICSFCQNNEFTHREVYLDRVTFNKDEKEKLTLQSFTCTSCGDIRLFQEKFRYDHSLQKHISIIEYTEVIKNEQNR